MMEDLANRVSFYTAELTVSVSCSCVLICGTADMRICVCRGKAVIEYPLVVGKFHLRPTFSFL
jgi:hypothetical protein